MGLTAYRRRLTRNHVLTREHGPKSEIRKKHAALILRYKQAFVDWINAADPSPTSPVTLPEVNQEHTVYLVDVEDEDRLATWLTHHHQEVFEQELWRVVHRPKAVAARPVAEGASGVVLIRAPHGGSGFR